MDIMGSLQVIIKHLLIKVSNSVTHLIFLYIHTYNRTINFYHVRQSDYYQRIRNIFKKIRIYYPLKSVANFILWSFYRFYNLRPHWQVVITMFLLAVMYLNSTQSSLYLVNKYVPHALEYFFNSHVGKDFVKWTKETGLVTNANANFGAGANDFKHGESLNSPPANANHLTSDDLQIFPLKGRIGDRPYDQGVLVIYNYDVLSPVGGIKAAIFTRAIANCHLNHADRTQMQIRGDRNATEAFSSGGVPVLNSDGTLAYPEINTWWAIHGDPDKVFTDDTQTRLVVNNNRATGDPDDPCPYDPENFEQADNNYLSWGWSHRADQTAEKDPGNFYALGDQNRSLEIRLKSANQGNLPLDNARLLGTANPPILGSSRTTEVYTDVIISDRENDARILRGDTDRFSIRAKVKIYNPQSTANYDWRKYLNPYEGLRGSFQPPSLAQKNNIKDLMNSDNQAYLRYFDYLRNTNVDFNYREIRDGIPYDLRYFANNPNDRWKFPNVPTDTDVVCRNYNKLFDRNITLGPFLDDLNRCNNTFIPAYVPDYHKSLVDQLDRASRSEEDGLTPNFIPSVVDRLTGIPLEEGSYTTTGEDIGTRIDLPAHASVINAGTRSLRIDVPNQSMVAPTRSSNYSLIDFNPSTDEQDSLYFPVQRYPYCTYMNAVMGGDLLGKNTDDSFVFGGRFFNSQSVVPLFSPDRYRNNNSSTITIGLMIINTDVSNELTTRFAIAKQGAGRGTNQQNPSTMNFNITSTNNNSLIRKIRFNTNYSGYRIQDIDNYPPSPNTYDESLDLYFSQPDNPSDKAYQEILVANTGGADISNGMVSESGHGWLNGANQINPDTTSDGKNPIESDRSSAAFQYAFNLKHFLTVEGGWANYDDGSSPARFSVEFGMWNHVSQYTNSDGQDVVYRPIIGFGSCSIYFAKDTPPSCDSSTFDNNLNRKIYTAPIPESEPNIVVKYSPSVNFVGNTSYPVYSLVNSSTIINYKKYLKGALVLTGTRVYSSATVAVSPVRINVDLRRLINTEATIPDSSIAWAEFASNSTQESRLLKIFIKRNTSTPNGIDLSSSSFAVGHRLLLNLTFLPSEFICPDMNVNRASLSATVKCLVDAQDHYGLQWDFGFKGSGLALGGSSRVNFLVTTQNKDSSLSELPNTDININIPSPGFTISSSGGGALSSTTGVTSNIVVYDNGEALRRTLDYGEFEAAETALTRETSFPANFSGLGSKRYYIYVRTIEGSNYHTGSSATNGWVKYAETNISFSNVCLREIEFRTGSGDFRTYDRNIRDSLRTESPLIRQYHARTGTSVTSFMYETKYNQENSNTPPVPNTKSFTKDDNFILHSLPNSPDLHRDMINSMDTWITSGLRDGMNSGNVFVHNAYIGSRIAPPCLDATISPVGWPTLTIGGANREDNIGNPSGTGCSGITDSTLHILKLNNVTSGMTIVIPNRNGHLIIYSKDHEQNIFVSDYDPDQNPSPTNTAYTRIFINANTTTGSNIKKPSNFILLSDSATVGDRKRTFHGIYLTNGYVILSQDNDDANHYSQTTVYGGILARKGIILPADSNGNFRYQGTEKIALTINYKPQYLFKLMKDKVNVRASTQSLDSYRTIVGL